jgi:soluble lytic murein transglycosylase-like protein
MTRIPLLPALLIGATLVSAHPAAANSLNNRAWWTHALKGVEVPTVPSAAGSALPAAGQLALAPAMLPTHGLAGGSIPAPASPNLAQPGGGAMDVGYDLCLGPIHRAEREQGIPVHLLRSIALTESGRWDNASGRTIAWPWTINAAGVGHFFPNKAAAIAAAHQFRAKGIRSIDIGCMQINMVWHPDAFKSLEEAFDPDMNARYAARYLADLKEERKTWTEAVGYYHSATPEHNQRYRAKVLKTWAEVQRNPEATMMASAAADASPSSAGGRLASDSGANFISGGPGMGAGRMAMGAPVAAMSGQRGMKLAQYRAAPTMAADSMPRTLGSTFGVVR